VKLLKLLRLEKIQWRIFTRITGRNNPLLKSLQFCELLLRGHSFPFFSLSFFLFRGAKRKKKRKRKSRRANYRLGSFRSLLLISSHERATRKSEVAWNPFLRQEISIEDSDRTQPIEINTKERTERTGLVGCTCQQWTPSSPPGGELESRGRPRPAGGNWSFSGASFFGGVAGLTQKFALQGHFWGDFVYN